MTGKKSTRFWVMTWNKNGCKAYRNMAGAGRFRNRMGIPVPTGLNQRQNVTFITQMDVDEYFDEMMDNKYWSRLMRQAHAGELFAA